MQQNTGDSDLNKCAIKKYYSLSLSFICFEKTIHELQMNKTVQNQ